jgi:hypothetical protein
MGIETAEGKLVLKPQAISEFVPDKNSDGTYNKDFAIRLTIKIGDIIGKLCLSYEVDYDDPNRARKVKHFIYGFDQLMQAVTIDVDEFVLQYTESIPVYLEEIKNQTQLAKIKTWETSWIHEFVRNVKAIGYQGLSINIPSKELFISDEYHLSYINVTLTYRNKETNISREVEKGKIKYVLPHGYGYGGSKETKYISPENIVDGFIKRVNEFWSKQDIKKTNEEQRQLRIKESLAKYTELFGNCVHAEKVDRYTVGPRKYEEYKTDAYYIPLNDKIVNGNKLSRKIKISAEKDNMFSFGGFTYLSQCDVIQMLAILNNV